VVQALHGAAILLCSDGVGGIGRAAILLVHAQIPRILAILLNSRKSPPFKYHSNGADPWILVQRMADAHPSLRYLTMGSYLEVPCAAVCSQHS
jgi:hypothetical protein